MISHKHKSIFVGIHKTGSHSVLHLLNDPQPEHRFWQGAFDPDWSSAVDFEDYFKFAIVRNPWDRFISAWRFISATRRLPIDTVLANLPRRGGWRSVPHRSVRATVAYAKSTLAIDLLRTRSLVRKGSAWSKSRARHDAHYYHVSAPQTGFILRDGQFILDEVYCLERFNDAVHDLAEKIGIDASRYPHANKSPDPQRRDYRDHFNRESRRLFEVAFSGDIEMLGYSFEDGPGAPPSWFGRPGGFRAHLQTIQAERPVTGTNQSGR